MEIVSGKNKQQYTKLGVNKNLLALISIILLVTPILIIGSLNFIGKEPYLIDRLSTEFIKNGFEPTDNLSYSGRAYSYPLGTIAISSLLSSLTNSQIAIILLPIILGIFSVILFYKILEKLKLNKWIISIATLILIISPPFIYTFS